MTEAGWAQDRYYGEKLGINPKDALARRKVVEHYIQVHIFSPILVCMVTLIPPDNNLLCNVWTHRDTESNGGWRVLRYLRYLIGC